MNYLCISSQAGSPSEQNAHVRKNNKGEVWSRNSPYKQHYSKFYSLILWSLIMYLLMVSEEEKN